MKKENKLFIGLLIVCICLLALWFVMEKMNVQKRTTNNAEVIDTTIDEKNDTNINWGNTAVNELVLSDSVTIKEGGIYRLTGVVKDGCVSIDTDKDIKLILANVSITNSNGNAILVKNAKSVTVELEEGTNNYLADGSGYTNEENEIGTIFSHDDLYFTGEGSLEVVSNTEDAIVGKDDIKFISGNYTITSTDDGIRGKDSVTILNGSFLINCKGDAIKATNDTDDNKGFVLIENGEITINADADGIQAEKKLVIRSGNFNITTGGGSANASAHTGWGFFEQSSDDTSTKAIKSGDNLLIEDGNFVIDSSDDAIHCNNYVQIVNGTYTISTGDDAIHADKELIIDGGSIDIKKSYEGLEAQKITINNGIISIVSSDDGINAAGKTDGATMMNHHSANNASAAADTVLTINGGSITVNASGDGLDANGSIIINGGETIVYGPSDNNNGALDYDMACEVNGGSLIAAGASGMMQTIGEGSAINGVAIAFNQNLGANDVVSIVDDSGNSICEFKGLKSFNSIVVANNKLKENNSYKVLINGSEYSTFTVSQTSNMVGNISNGNNPGFGGGKPNGRRP